MTHDHASILMYHSVGPRTDYYYTVTVDNFRRQMAYLHKHTISVISLEECIRRLRNNESLEESVVLTFDDGYRNNYTTVFPILKKYNFPATIFLQTGLVGGSDKRDMERLTEEDLHEMQLSGLVSIQPHTVTHPRLTLVDSKQLQIEVRESKRYIEVLLGNVCRAFAYPYGKSNVEIIRALMDGGYEYALTTQSGVVSPAHLFKENGMYLLPRNDINQSISLDEFIRLVAPGKSWIRRYVDRIQLYF